MHFLRLSIGICLSISLNAASFLAEGFADINALPGWEIVNNSTPGGPTPEGWFQGTGVFTAPSGAPNSYAQANFLNAGAGGDISTWLLTPMLLLQPGTLLRFSTIGEDVAGFPDRLEVRLSTNGASTDVGSTPSSVGDFTELLLSVNPGLTDSGYPTTWTEYSYIFSGLAAPVNSRIAFRYFVPDRSINASTIGLDTVLIIPEPSTEILASLGIVVFVFLRYRRRLHRAYRRY
jgi:hypothetical protein